MSENDRTATPDDAPPPLPRRIWLNFLLLAALWIGVVLWSWWFTDLRVESLIGALGGLGLFLAPLWLLDKLPRLAAGFEDAVRKLVAAVLASRWTTAVLAVLTAAAVAASLCVGTLQLESRLEEATRVELLRGGESSATVDLPAGAAVRRPLWTGFAGSAEIAVEVECFTPDRVTIRPWSRPTFQVPGDVTRTALLLLPSVDLSDFAAPGMEWEIGLPGEAEPRRLAFDGHPLWIGIDAGCPVPETARERVADRPRMRERLAAPRGLDGEPARLDPGDEVRVTVHMRGTPLAERTLEVEGVGTQTEVLDV